MCFCGKKKLYEKWFSVDIGMTELVCLSLVWLALGAETTDSDADGWSLSSLILSNNHMTITWQSSNSHISLNPSASRFVQPFSSCFLSSQTFCIITVCSGSLGEPRMG